MALDTSNLQVEDQIRRLSLIRKLWSVSKNVFSTPWLSSPAEAILIAILKRDFCISDATVRGAWSKLCAELASTGVPGLLEIVCVQSEHRREIEIKRQLWSVLAKTWEESEDRFTWQDAVSFLGVPFG